MNSWPRPILFYGHDQEEEARAQEKEKRKETQHTQLLATHVAQSMSRGSPGPDQNSKKDNKCSIYRETGHWTKSCPNRDKPPQSPCYKCKEMGHWAALCPMGCRVPGPLELPMVLELLSQEGRGPGRSAPIHDTDITGLESRVTMDMAGRTIFFLIDTEASYSVLGSYFGTLSSWTCIALGVTGTPTTRPFRGLLHSLYFSHPFLVVTECPISLLGWDILEKLHTRMIFSFPRASQTPLQLLVVPEQNPMFSFSGLGIVC